MRRKPPPGAPRLERSSESIELEVPVAIFCEGKTEEVCLKGLRAKWRVASASVHLVGQVGVPKTVVKAAKDYAKKNIKDDPKIVVVFDRDEHPSWEEAITMARDNGFVIAVSNPCIELWGLLLHRDQTAAIHRHQAQSDLAGVHPKYHHSRHPYFDLKTVLAFLDDAALRGEGLAKRAREAGQELGNPTTSFSRAIEAFRPTG